ncbi:MAG: TolC family protein [Burkholderiaceae bacterium]
MLGEPLTEDSAVQIALLNNPGLQAAYQELGISESEVVQAGTLPNPGFSFGKFRRGDEREIERAFHINLAKIVFMPIVKDMAARQFRQTQTMVTTRILSLGAQTRKAFYEAVSGKERLTYMRQVKATAETGADLARRMALIGNITKVQQAREQGFYADSVLTLTQAIRQQHAAREKLTRLMGLWGAQTAFELPDRLPDLPDSAEELPEAERTALAQRLDVQSAKRNVEQMAKNLGLTKVNRFVNVLEFGYSRETSNEAPRRTGYEIGFEIPLFNWSGAKTRMAESIYMQAVHQAAESAINARSEVREAYVGYRSAYDVARLYRDEIVPTKQRVSEENLYRYNGMIIGVFELIADARSQIAAVDGYIQALRDFWVAKADLDMAMIGKPSLTPMAAAGPSGGGGDGGGH